MDLSGSGLGLLTKSSDHGNNLSYSVKDGKFRDLLEEQCIKDLVF